MIKECCWAYTSFTLRVALLFLCMDAYRVNKDDWVNNWTINALVALGVLWCLAMLIVSLLEITKEMDRKTDGLN